MMSSPSQVTLTNLQSMTLVLLLVCLPMVRHVMSLTSSGSFTLTSVLIPSELDCDRVAYRPMYVIQYLICCPHKRRSIMSGQKLMPTGSLKTGVSR